MNILYFFLSATGITTVIIWIGKLIITKSFDIGVEKYKSELTKEIEKYKAQIAKVALEHQVKFSKLHEQRAEIMKLLYLSVVELERLLINCTSVAQGPDYILDNKRDNDAMNKTQELIGQLDNNRIYFSDSTIEKFEAIIKESWEIIFQMRKVRRDGVEATNYSKMNRPIPEYYLRSSDLWDQAFERTNKEFKILKKELIGEFRTLLGIA